jgi:hypothetical protein
MIETIYLFVAGIYAGLFLAKKGVSLEAATAPIERAFKWIKGKLFENKKEEESPSPPGL